MGKLSDQMRQIQCERDETLRRHFEQWAQMERTIAENLSLVNQLFDWFVAEVSQGDPNLRITVDDGIYSRHVEVKSGRDSFLASGTVYPDHVKLSVGNETVYSGPPEASRLSETLGREFLAWYKSIHLPYS